MAHRSKNKDFENLPGCAAEFISLVIRKMRYRKKVRADVQAELATHFEDALKDCRTDEEKEQLAQKLIADFGDAKMLAKLLRRGKKRCRPLWRTIVAGTFQAIGILFVCFVFYCVYISLGKPTVSVNYIQETTRLVRPIADESLNAAPLYEKAIKFYVQPSIVERKVSDDLSIRRPQKRHSIKPRIEKVTLFEVIREKKWPSELTEEQLSLLKEWLASNQQALQLFKQACRKPYCWWQLQAKDNVLLNVLAPQLREMRDFARLLCWRAKLRASDGYVQQAFDDLETCYHTCRHLRGPRGLVEQLVGIAMRALCAKSAFTILQETTVNVELLENFQKNIEEEFTADNFVINFEVEKFLFRDIIQRCYTDNGNGSGHLIPGKMEEYGLLTFGEVDDVFEPYGDKVQAVAGYVASLAVALISTDRQAMLAKFEGAFDRYQRCAEMTPWQLKQKNLVDSLEKEFEASRIKQMRYFMYYYLLPSFNRVNELSYRSKAEMEGLITTIAILRYKSDYGYYPENLQQLLTKTYIKQLPMDPFSDKPLVYRKTEENFVLYSVGLNFKDDRGLRYGKQPWGHREKGDAVFWPVETSKQCQERLKKEEQDR